MTFLRRGRFFWWLARELSRKYAPWLVFGFIVGLTVTVGFGRVLPFIVTNWFSPVDRIGIIGEFTPSTLPIAIQQQISDGLTEIAPDGSAKPGLASSWQVESDGKTYFFALRSDLTWHNGKPVVASDVNYNIKNVALHVAGPHLLKVTLDEPYSPFVTIVSKPILEAGLVGFGPYKVAAIRLNGDKVQYLKLMPVEKRLKSKEYWFYKTETNAITAYKLGDIDEIEELTSPGELSGWKNTTVQKKTKSDRVVALFFNTHDQLTGEKALRQALAYGVPKFDEEQAFSPIAATSWAYNDKIRHYLTDPDHAKKLLSGSSATEGATLTLTTFSQYVDTAQAIANSWNSLGIKTAVQVQNALPPGFQVLLSAQDVPPDPDQYPFWHTTQTATNITGYSNLKIDKLLEDGRKEFDMDKRKKLYDDFQRYLVEDAPAVFLFNAPYYTVTRTKLINLF